MSIRTVSDDATCAHCGSVHIVTYSYSTMSAANSERESTKCKACGEILVNERCLAVESKLK